jgi:predicted nucleotidyltransferase
LLKEIRAQDSGIDKLLYELENGLKDIFGKRLKKVILYGSYARGNSDEGSDIDIMVLIDMNEMEIKSRRDRVLDMIVDLTTRYGIVLSIIENNHDYFYDWVDVIPFFANVEREGVSIYGEN